MKKSEKMLLIAKFIEANDNYITDDIINNDEVVILVDHREEDGEIIENCEAILETGTLSAKYVKAENKRGFDLIITFRNIETIIPYEGEGADRDTTIKTLNNVLMPNYEIRLIKATRRADTLGFVPLRTKAWEVLETRYGEKVAAKFEKLEAANKLFV